jgi:uncharacterized repeat protein (TIGR01451 family)
MARKHNFRLQRNNRAFAAVVLAGPLVALLSPLLSTTASATTAGPAAAMRLTSAPSLARMGSAANPSKHPATPHPSTPATPYPSTSASAHPSTSAAAPKPAAAASGAAAAHLPELSIAVSDGRQHVQPGDLLTYAVKIHNIGKRNVPRLRIVQTLPVNMKLISATRHPTRHAGQLTWHLNLPAQHVNTFHVVGRVGRTPRQLLRLATIACANIGGSARPIVCAAHSDELPAGAIAAAHASHAAAARSQPGYLRLLGAALVLAVVASGSWLVFRLTRRRGHRAS